jgi:hypothetical protein
MGEVDDGGGGLRGGGVWDEESTLRGRLQRRQGGQPLHQTRGRRMRPQRQEKTRFLNARRPTARDGFFKSSSRSLRPWRASGAVGRNGNESRTPSRAAIYFPWGCRLLVQQTSRTQQPTGMATAASTAPPPLTLRRCRCQPQDLTAARVRDDNDPIRHSGDAVRAPEPPHRP